VSRKKETEMFFVISSTKLGRFWWNLVHHFLNKFTAKLYKRITERYYRIYHTSTVALIFAGFESSWLQYVGIIVTGVQNTHHWSGRTETATENDVGQFGSWRHCGSHWLVASLIAPDQWCVLLFCTPSISHILLSTRFKSGEFGGHSWRGINSGVSFCNNGTTCLMSISNFTRYCRDIIQVRWKTFTRFCSKFIQETLYQISSESPNFCRRYYEKQFGRFFSGHNVYVRWHWQW